MGLTLCYLLWCYCWTDRFGVGGFILLACWIAVCEVDFTLCGVCVGFDVRC